MIAECPRPGLRLSLVACAAIALAGCQSDRGLYGGPLTSVGVVAGDFDEMAEPLLRMDVRHDVYEGIISVATYDTEWDYEGVALKVETLLSDTNVMTRYDGVFIASGTRGFGVREYNGLDADNQLVSDPVVLEEVRSYVEDHNGTLFVTDWSYDLVEAIWPDAIDFLGDDITIDAAQRGEIGFVQASVEEEGLAEVLEISTLPLEYNYSNWAPIESVHPDTTVWARGDVEYRLDGGSGFATLTDSPLLVSFNPEGGGRVVYATFHVNAQLDHTMDRLLNTVVGDFSEGPGASVGF
ncbi:MAG: hypothetical protein EP330_10040 [Deltaproteobacteria bacterium]|nr:MAG: hypothetical protein EP330_10040 [Deltaproteobacteria bacterium]